MTDSKLNDSLTITKTEDENMVMPLFFDTQKVTVKTFLISTIVSDIILMFIAIGWASYILNLFIDFREENTQEQDIKPSNNTYFRSLFSLDYNNPIIMLISVITGGGFLVLFSFICLILNLSFKSARPDNIINRIYSVLRIKALISFAILFWYNFFVDEFDDVQTMGQSKNRPMYLLIILLFLLTIYPCFIVGFNTSFVMLKITFRTYKNIEEVDPNASEHIIKFRSQTSKMESRKSELKLPEVTK